MFARKIPPDIVSTGLTALFKVLVDVVEYKQPADIVRPPEPVQHVRHHDIDIIVACQDEISAPVWNLAFGYFAGIAGKTLPQVALRPAIQPEDRAEGGLVAPSKVSSQLRLPDAAQPIEDKYSPSRSQGARSREEAPLELVSIGLSVNKAVRHGRAMQSKHRPVGPKVWHIRSAEGPNHK